MENKNFDKEVREAQREYFRAWRAANKDKVREHNRRYWEKRTLKQQQEQKEQKSEDNA